MSELVGIALILFFGWIVIQDLRIRLGSSSPPIVPPVPPMPVPIPPAKPAPRAATQQEPKARAQLPTAVPLKDLPPDIARLIRGLPDRSLDELQRQWLNVIDKIEAAGTTAAGPFLAFRAALIAEWARRLAVAEADPRVFPWPTTKAPKGKSGLDSGDWHLIGMLSYLGYRVGATAGVSEGIRRQILDVCFDGPLPPINGIAYMRAWGAPGSTMRLSKLANELASFARNGKRKRSANLATAVADWEADLNYMYRQYYVGKFKFAWPYIS
jgi:hypothetical protein